MTAASPRLLLVDDDEAACTLLAEVLERESYSVVRALSGAEGRAEEAVLDRLLSEEVVGMVRPPERNHR